MIVVFYNEGQLGNRLFYFSHFISLSIELNQRLTFFCFDEYYPFFEGTKNNNISFFNVNWIKSKSSFLKKTYQFILFQLYVFCKKFNISNRIVSVYKPNHAGDSDTIDYSVNSILEDKKFKKSLLTLYDGSYTWYDNTNLNIYRNEIIPFFKPIKSITEKVDAFIFENRIDFDILIGIHIRRGDYKEFANGIFCYNNDIYTNFMKQMQLLLKNRVRFVISSNESIDKNVFSAFNHVFSIGELVEDMYVLSKCDYIIGPPSSFSAWSSFYGQKPLYQIFDKNSLLHLEDFKIVKNREFVC